MSKFLVVANQTAISAELTGALMEKAKGDRAAQFILVVPATPVEHLQTHEEGEARQIAARRAGRALTHLVDAGIPIVGAHVGAISLEDAIGEALAEHTSDFDGIIISTLPPAASRCYSSDLASKLESRFKLPVTHIETG